MFIYQSQQIFIAICRRLPDGSKVEQSCEEIVEEVISAVNVAKKHGVQDVRVSLLIDHCRFRSKAKEVNCLLR